MESITAVAARIQERALQLNSERATLEVTLAELEEAHDTLRSESKENDAIRQKQLSIIISRNQLDLEIMNLRNETESLKAKSTLLEKEINEAQKSRDAINERFRDVVTNVYAKHNVRRELYRKTTMGRIERRNERKRKRRETIDALTREADKVNDEATSMHREREKIREEQGVLDKREEREDEELAALAMQIKATLAKKTSLRDALEDARKCYKEANDHALKWEQERAMLSRMET